MLMMMDVVKNSANPQQTIELLLSRNPQYNNVIGLIKESGGDAKSAFYKLAEQKGVDPETILKLLK